MNLCVMLLTIYYLNRCITNETAHFERHREIARLFNDLQSCDDGSQTPVRRRKHSNTVRINEDQSLVEESTATDISSVDPISPDAILANDVDVVETSRSRSAKRALKRSMKNKQDQNKALKNQQRIVLNVSQAHINRVAKAIHGPQYNLDGVGGHPGTNGNDSDAMFDRNDSYTAAIKTHRLWFTEQVRVSRARRGKMGSEAQRKQLNEDMKNGLSVQEPDMEDLVSAVLLKLGLADDGKACSNVTGDSSKTSTPCRKRMTTILLQLRKEIAADIDKSENESRARQQRMEGYRRYVSGTVTNRLANNAQSANRSTGVRLKAEATVQLHGKILEKDLIKDIDG